MIRVLLVDDSKFIREQLRVLLAGDTRFQVVGEAWNGMEACERVAALRPDLIILDVDMPKMDGIRATQYIMEHFPTPIVMFTSSTISMQRNLPFEGIRAGALDILLKPDIFPLPERDRREFLQRIEILASVHVFRRTARGLVSEPDTDPESEPVPQPFVSNRDIPRVLAVAASTGGPKALSELFSLLPPVLPFPILLVQHIGREFLDGFASWLQMFTGITMRIATDGEILMPNTCYLSPGDRHLSLRSASSIMLDDAPPVNSSRPSADVLFHAVQRVFGAHGVGVLLTGIGRDGADGLHAMHEAGAITLAQDEKSSVVFGMPRKAIEMNAVSYVGNIEQIASTVIKLFRLDQ
jgi:two-component system, chemotaxis family, protein-glutamate methylesterase/glutaminase